MFSRQLFERFISIGIAIALLSFAGCDILSQFEEEQEDTSSEKTIDAEAVAGMEVVGGLMEALFEGAGAPEGDNLFPDFAAGTYPTGIAVATSASGESSVTLTITIENAVPESEESDALLDLVYNGSFTLLLESKDGGKELKITMNGSLSASGTDAVFATLIVTGAVAEMPVGEDGPGDPTSVEGTLTIDGTDYDMASIELGDDVEQTPPSPTEAHYFLMSYYTDEGTDRPQVVYSSDTNSWGTIQLSGTGTLRDGATNGSGRTVAVGDNGMVFSTDDGATWVRRASGLTTAHLLAVHWANSRWVAVGTNTIISSSDGVTWTASWTPAGPAENTTLRAVSYGSGGQWMAAGEPPHNYLISSDNGVSWSVAVADGMNRPQQPVRQLLWTSDDTPWLSATGDFSSGAIYDGGDADSDGDLDWTAGFSGGGEARGMARFGTVYAASLFNGATTIASSTDAGDSWTSHAVSGSLNGYPVDMTAISNGFLMVTNMGGLVRGSADGQTWQVITPESWGSWGIVFRP